MKSWRFGKYLLTFCRYFDPARFSENFMNLYPSTGPEDLNLQKILLLFLTITWPFLVLLTSYVYVVADKL
jgi:hypothetical protein